MKRLIKKMYTRIFSRKNTSDEMNYVKKMSVSKHRRGSTATKKMPCNIADKEQHQKSDYRALNKDATTTNITHNEAASFQIQCSFFLSFIFITYRGSECLSCFDCIMGTNERTNGKKNDFCCCCLVLFHSNARSTVSL